MNRPAATALIAYGRDLDVAKLERALIAVDDRIEELRAALKPFADAGATNSAAVGDLPGMISNLCVNDFKRAAIQLFGDEQKLDEEG